MQNSAPPIVSDEAIASERKALAREVLHLERAVLDFGNRVKVTRGTSSLRQLLKESATALKIAREKLSTFDRDLMDE